MFYCVWVFDRVTGYETVSKIEIGRRSSFTAVLQQLNYSLVQYYIENISSRTTEPSLTAKIAVQERSFTAHLICMNGILGVQLHSFENAIYTVYL